MDEMRADTSGPSRKMWGINFNINENWNGRDIVVKHMYIKFQENQINFSRVFFFMRLCEGKIGAVFIDDPHDMNAAKRGRNKTRINKKNLYSWQQQSKKHFRDF